MKLRKKGLEDENATYLTSLEGDLAREELKARLGGLPVKELQQEASAMVVGMEQVELETLHRRMGHASMDRVKELVKKGMVKGKVMITRDVVFYEEVNYLQWKGVEKEIAAAGTAIAPDKVDDLLEEKESEGVGDEGDEELEDVERADSVDWVWEKAPTREADESKVVEIAGEQPSKEVAEDGIDEVAEEEGDEESAAEGDSDPWKLLNSDDNNAKMREIEELLEEGAIVIGREVKNGEGKALADSSEDEVESLAEELGKGKRVLRVWPALSLVLPPRSLLRARVTPALFSTGSSTHAHVPPQTKGPLKRKAKGGAAAAAAGEKGGKGKGGTVATGEKGGKGKGGTVATGEKAGGVSVQECVERYTAEERLDGGNQMCCEQCGRKTDATRRVCIHSVPPVLNLHLMRFVFDAKTMSKKKVTSGVRIPLTLDLSPYVVQPRGDSCREAGEPVAEEAAEAAAAPPAAAAPTVRAGGARGAGAAGAGAGAGGAGVVSNAGCAAGDGRPRGGKRSNRGSGVRGEEFRQWGGGKRRGGSARKGGRGGGEEEGAGKAEAGEGKAETGEGQAEAGKGRSEAGEGKAEAGEGKAEAGEEQRTAEPSQTTSEPPRPSLKYQLVAILQHKSRQASCGHYVAHVKEVHCGEWWLYNDEEVVRLGRHPMGEGKGDKGGVKASGKGTENGADGVDARDGKRSKEGSEEEWVSEVSVNGYVHPPSCGPQKRRRVGRQRGLESFLKPAASENPPDETPDGSGKAPLKKQISLLTDSVAAPPGKAPVRQRRSASLAQHVTVTSKKQEAVCNGVHGADSGGGVCGPVGSRKRGTAVNGREGEGEEEEVTSADAYMLIYVREGFGEGEEGEGVGFSGFVNFDKAASAIEGPIDNTPLLCPSHGLVPRASLPLMKRVSPVAWAMLVSQYEGGPALSQVACCSECLIAEALAAVSAGSYREERARVRLLVEENIKGRGIDRPGYYVSKPWLNSWLRRTKADAPTAADSNPLGGIVCPHLGLMPEGGGGEARRAVVSGEVWGWLKLWAEEGRRRGEEERVKEAEEERGEEEEGVRRGEEGKVKEAKGRAREAESKSVHSLEFPASTAECAVCVAAAAEAAEQAGALSLVQQQQRQQFLRLFSLRPLPLSRPPSLSPHPSAVTSYRPSSPISSPRPASSSPPSSPSPPSPLGASRKTQQQEPVSEAPQKQEECGYPYALIPSSWVALWRSFLSASPSAASRTAPIPTSAEPAPAAPAAPAATAAPAGAPACQQTPPSLDGALRAMRCQQHGGLVAPLPALFGGCTKGRAVRAAWGAGGPAASTG
ncbi:unnamed protein product [Closterium sp. Naga37s-1]|nr:unnamed protein product [Closterium sp. Naga37s-1]